MRILLTIGKSCKFVDKIILLKQFNSYNFTQASVTNIIVLLTAICFTALFCTVPLALDDYWYLADMNRFGTGADGEFNFFRGLVGTYQEHYLSDNGRLANLFGIPFLYLPRIIVGLISGFLVWVSLKLMTELSTDKNANFAIATLIVAIYTFVLPWSDYIFTTDFTFNYVWGGALMVFALAVFLHERKINSVLSFISGLVLGCWHEIFSVPILFGALLTFIFHRDYIRSDRIRMCAGLFIGFAWLWFAPARAAEAGFGQMISRDLPGLDRLGECWFPIAYIIFEMVILAFYKTRKLALSPEMLFGISGSLICLIIFILSQTHRVLFSGEILATIGLGFTLCHIFKKLLDRNKKIIIYSCSILWIVLLAHFVSAFTIGLKIRDEEEFIITEYLKSKDKDGTVFADVTTPDSAPWLSFGKPCQMWYTYYAHPQLVSEYFGGEFLKIIPPALKNYGEGRGNIINSNREIRNFEGHPVAKFDGRYRSWPFIHANVKYENGRELMTCAGYPFIGADSLEYIYLAIDGNGIKSIEFIE